MDSMHEWFVAKTKSHKEGTVVANLSRWDVESFYPKIIVKGRKGERLEPLFPTYLFVRVDRTSPLWPRIRWAPGVAYFLGTDGPTSISEKLIEHLRGRVQEWNRVPRGQHFTRGEQITVVDGPFAGMDGIFDRYVPARQRCQVLLNTVGGQMTLEMPAYDLKGRRQPQSVLA